MKISELIKHLEKLKQENGDVIVTQRSDLNFPLDDDDTTFTIIKTENINPATIYTYDDEFYSDKQLHIGQEKTVKAIIIK